MGIWKAHITSCERTVPASTRPFRAFCSPLAERAKRAMPDQLDQYKHFCRSFFHPAGRKNDLQGFCSLSVVFGPQAKNDRQKKKSTTSTSECSDPHHPTSA